VLEELEKKPDTSAAKTAPDQIKPEGTKKSDKPVEPKKSAKEPTPKRQVSDDRSKTRDKKTVSRSRENSQDYSESASGKRSHTRSPVKEVKRSRWESPKQGSSRKSPELSRNI
jgi:hypothetical protein